MMIQNGKHSKRDTKRIWKLSKGKLSPKVFMLVEVNIDSQKLPFKVEFPGGTWADGLLCCITYGSSIQSLSLVQLLVPHGLQQTRIFCPSSTLRACSNSCPSSQWCHPSESSYAIAFSSWHQSFPASSSFPMSQFFESGSQSIGASASTSVFPMNIQG